MSWSRNYNDKGHHSLAVRRSQVRTDVSVDWPIGPQRQRIAWFPARSRLISQVRTAQGGAVLPSAIVRKACWRD